MKKHSSKKKDLHMLLKSRNVLYIVLFLAVANLFSYLMLKQLDAVAFFIIIGFLTTYFSKNMIIVMLTAMVSTFLLVQINLLGRVQEGLEGISEGGEEKEKSADATAEEAPKEPAVAAPPVTSPPSSANNMSTPSQNTAGINTSNIVLGREEQAALTAIGEGTGAAGTSGMGAPGQNNKERFTQKLSPARYNANDDDTTPRHKPKIDYASTLESAYDNLDKLLSSDAIKNMTADTGRLAEKQKQLMGNIEKLTPIMDKASSVLSNLDIGGISGLMGGIQDKLKGFGKSAVVPTDG